MSLFRMHYRHVVQKIEYLIQNDYLIKDEFHIYKLTQKATAVLKELGLDYLDLRDIYENEEEEINLNEKNNLDILYIPKNFDKKFNGY